MDLKDISVEGILDKLKNDEQLSIYQDLSENLNPRQGTMRTFDAVMNQEDKLYDALGVGIDKQRGFNKNIKLTDMVKELSKDFDIDPPKVEFKYVNNIVGQANPSENILRINPEYIRSNNPSATIAHELRHLKEGQRRSSSIMDSVYSSSTNPLQDMLNSLEQEKYIKKMEGKGLNMMNKTNQRLFEKDILKGKVDALDIYDFMEKGHFKESFLKKNLMRVAKGLPLIGLAATVLTSEDAGAAIDPMGSETLGVDKAIEDPKSQEFKARQKYLELLNKMR